jgi:hypothetical protein
MRLVVAEERPSVARCTHPSQVHAVVGSPDQGLSRTPFRRRFSRGHQRVEFDRPQFPGEGDFSERVCAYPGRQAQAIEQGPRDHRIAPKVPTNLFDPCRGVECVAQKCDFAARITNLPYRDRASMQRSADNRPDAERALLSGTLSRNPAGDDKQAAHNRRVGDCTIDRPARNGCVADIAAPRISIRPRPLAISAPVSAPRASKLGVCGR